MTDAEQTKLNVCPYCGEPFEHGFEVCWKCGGSRDQPPAKDFAHDLQVTKTRVSPSTAWTFYALRIAFTFLAAAFVCLLGSAVVPEGSLQFGFTFAASACLMSSFGAFIAFVVLCFLPLRAVRRRSPNRADPPKEIRDIKPRVK